MSRLLPILPLYLIRLFAGWLLLTTFSLTLILLAFDLLNNVVAITANHSDTLGAIITYASLRLPVILNLCLPLAALLATIVTVVRLTAAQELVAIGAAGLSLYKITGIFLLCGLLPVIFQAGLSNLVLPVTAPRLAAWAKDDYRGMPAKTASLLVDQWLASGGDALVHIGSVDQAYNRASDIIAIQRGPDAGIVSFAKADYIDYANSAWQPGQAQVMNANGDLQAAATLPLALNFTPATLRLLSSDLGNQGFLSLLRLRHEHGVIAPQILSLWLQYRLAEPLTSLIMVLIGILIAFQPPRQATSGKSIMALVGLGFLYYIGARVLLSLGETGLLVPLTAAWLMPILFILGWRLVSVEAGMTIMPDKAITIRTAESKSDRDLFLQVPDAVYRGNPHYIKPLDLERRDFLSAKNPYFEHAHAQLFIAIDSTGQPVGRISAQLDTLAQKPGQVMLGHFGFLDAIDADVLKALITAAEAWLVAHGVKIVHGPYSFTINDESGLLVEGFDSPARMLMNYAQHWYGPALEACGYAKAKDLLAFRMNTATELPRAALIMARKALEAPLNMPAVITERPLNPKRFDADLKLILDIFNDAWADNWGYVPMTAAEIAHTAKSLKMLIRPKFARIFERDGKPLAMIVALPDLNTALRGLNGRLLPFGWLKLLWRLKVKPPKVARVLLMGTRRDHRVGFAAGAMAAALVATLRNALFDAGYTEAELSWVLEDNLPVIRLIESVGGVQYKRYRLYEKKL